MRIAAKLRSPRVGIAAGVAVVLVVVAGALWLRRDGGGVPETQRLGEVTVDQRWTLELPDPEGPDPDTPQVVVDGSSVFVAQYQRLRAFALDTGDELWDLGTGRVQALGAADGMVAARLSGTESDGGDELALFDGASGEQVWDGVSLDPDDSEPVIADGVVLARGIAESGGLQAIDIATGERRWNQPAAAGAPCSTPSGAATLWSDDPGDDTTPRVAVLSPEDGEPVVGPVTTEPAAGVRCSGGAVVVASESALVMHDPRTLEVLDVTEGCCMRNARVVGETTLVVDESELIGEDVYHTLVARDTPTGDELWRYRTPAVSAYDWVRYQRIDDGIVVTNDPEDEAGDDRRFTHLLDADGHLLGDIEEGVDEPSVLATAADGGSMVVIGDGEQLLGLALAARPASIPR